MNGKRQRRKCIERRRHFSVIIVAAVILSQTAVIFGGQPAQPSTPPRVEVNDDAVTISFSPGVGITFGRRPGKGVRGIRRLFIGGRDILSAPAGSMPPPSLKILSAGEAGGITSWEKYLEEREANGGRYPPRNPRSSRVVTVDDAEYLGWRPEGDGVAVRTLVREGGKSGELEWIVLPVTMKLGGRTYRGLGWKVRLIGLEGAEWLQLIEPAVARRGDWAFAQIWGDFIERRIDFVTPFNVPERIYFADAQPFFFTAGPAGAAVSFFDRPVAARLEVAEEAERHLLSLRVPLGKGSVRETPLKCWLWIDRSFPTKWAALDEWTAVFDALGDHYRAPLGLDVTEPEPTIVWVWPGDAYYECVRNRAGEECGEPWLDDYTRRIVPEAARLGFRVIYLQSPWECDAEYPSWTYVTGGRGWGSAQAPWHLNISESIGGEDSLADLCRTARSLGIKVILWTPISLSNSSPLLREHPEWIMWRESGIPDDFDWGDVTGVNLRRGFYDYAVGRYRDIRQKVLFDGIFQDSFLTFGIVSDYSERQPFPQLDQTVALQRDLKRMGAGEIHIEGCGPFGLSAAGFGHEPPVPEDLDRVRGREYGLYRYVADVYIEPESYYRALASKGVIGAASLAEFNKLTAPSRARVVRANHDYLQVMDKMERRHLIGEGDTWQGVAWTRTNSSERVLFAFQEFRYRLNGSATVKNVTTGKQFFASGGFQTKPMETYLIGSPIVFFPYQDFNGDGTSDIALFRGENGLWSILDVTRCYFGRTSDLPVSGDYNGDGTSEIAIFRPASGLWAVRDETRVYFGGSGDAPVPGDYDNDGLCEMGIFRADSGLWAVKGVTRTYLGAAGDIPVPGDYDGDGGWDIAFFRPASGLWLLKGINRFYFGSSSDTVVPGDYDGDGGWEVGIFRPPSGMWALRGVTRVYFGEAATRAVPADYDGDFTDDVGIFRSTTGLWAVKGFTRTYFGTSGDVPVTR